MGWNYVIGQEATLTEEQHLENAILFYWFFKPRGYSDASISGMLGNIEQEASTINPGCQELGGDGWGLIQWTPHTILTNWVAIHGWDWFDGNAQCELIAEEIESNRSPWIPTSRYPYNADEFKALDNPIEAMMAYMYERERPNPDYANIPNRERWANYWYEYFTGSPPPPPPPDPPVPPTPTKSKMKWIYYLKPFYKR